MKRLFALVIIGMLTFSTPVYASTQSLDEIVNQIENVESEQPDTGQMDIGNEITSMPVGLNYIKEADDLGDLSTAASKINTQLHRAASLVVQVLAYFITAFLAVRVLVDLCYITLPFSRRLLYDNGNNEMQSSLSMNMGNSIGGNGRMSMGSPMGMQTINQNSGGSNRKIAWVSNAAVRAVALEFEQRQDGMRVNAFRYYAKDMIIVLVVTPILLVLAITGTLTDLGFLLGEMINNVINNMGNMI